PGMALCLAVFILSLAGVPPLAGFFGKFYLFVTVLGGETLGNFWLVLIAAVTACVAFYYYLRVLKAVFVEPPGAEWSTAIGGVERGTVCLAAVLVVAAGCAPGWALGPLLGAAGGA